MKTTILFIFMLLFGACSQGPKTQAKFAVTLGALTGSVAQPGGLMIYGHDATKSKIFAQALTTASQSMQLDNGEWTFYAIGWAGPQQMAGQVRCAQASASLTGEDVSVNLTLTTATCNNSAFTASGYFASTSQVQNLSFVTCSDLVGVTAGGDCASTQGGHGSVQVSLVNYTGSAASTAYGSAEFISSCQALTAGGVTTATSLNLPVGGSAFSLATKIKAFASIDCSGTAGNEYIYQSGLINGASTVNTQALYDNADTTKLFLLSDLPLSIPSSVSISSPSPANSLTTGLSVSGVNNGATVKIYDDAACTNLLGSGVASGTTVSISVTNAAAGSYRYYATQETSSTNTSACSSPTALHMIDTTPPVISTPVWTGPAISNSTSQTLNWSMVEANGYSSTRLYLYSDAGCTAEISNFVLTNGALTHTLTGLTSQGYYAKIVAQDDVLNIGQSACSTIKTVDIVVPSTATTLAWAVASPTNTGPSIAVNWVKSVSADLDNQNVLLYSDGTCTNYVSGAGVSSAVQTYNLNIASEGTYSFRINSIDLASNVSQSACSGPLVVDRTITAPTIARLTASPSIVTTPTFQFNGLEAGSTVEIFISSATCSANLMVTEVAGTSSHTTLSGSFSLPMSVPGDYSFYGRATDSAGNVSACVSAGVYGFRSATAPATPVIKGVIGGSDSIQDNIINNATAIISWEASASYLPTYNIVIRNADDTTDVCPLQTTTGLSFNFSGCTLTLGTSYVAKLFVSDDLARNSPTTSLKFTYRWSLVSPSSPPSVRYEHAAAWTGDELLIWGGRDTSTWKSDGYRYDPTSLTWTMMATNSLSARANHVGIWCDGRFVVWGGVSGANTYYGDGAIYDPAMNSWTAMASPTSISSRASAVAVCYNNQVIIWGGMSFSGSTIYHNDGEIYSPSLNTWSPFASGASGSVPALRARTAHGMVGDKLVIWGGNGPAALGTGSVYDFSDNSWTTITLSGAPSARFRMGFTVSDTELYIYGGVGIGNVYQTGLGYRYNPATNVWATHPVAVSAQAVADVKMAWNGKQVVAWGGETYEDLGGAGGFTTNTVNSGFIFDPATSAVNPTPVISADGRKHHSFVWNGYSFIVYGGNRYFNDEIPTTTNIAKTDIFHLGPVTP